MKPIRVADISDLVRIGEWTAAVDAWELGEGVELVVHYLKHYGVDQPDFMIDDIVQMLTTKPNPLRLPKRRTLEIWRAVGQAKMFRQINAMGIKTLGKDSYPPDVRRYMMRSVYEVAAEIFNQRFPNEAPVDVETVTRSWRRCPNKKAWPHARAFVKTRQSRKG